ncbi:hypothetical protein [Paenibacillus radicis (ex Gao et al. 2016)]|uniref:Uncharacterized protein n=1 Tax=Paenibacillus radicis (ex Gao et al. 2016) TaxID=1737354 RepID=A0A917M9X0_9BACL|nr:hypothetical protein [Paenibacillus radicis (ex Gao et al. 2016)]GGG87099.1 hypothetical protein GCM10010918_51710 [Paenibacillus radicis (ex Gao et al. 2016)]
MSTFDVTCISIGNYGHALLRGKTYTVFDEKNENYRITGNHGRRVWISKYYFVEGKHQIPILTSWKLDDEINEFELLEVTLTFTDSSKRWCLITTPDKLKNYLMDQVTSPPGINIQHLIIMKTLNQDDIEETLNYLDNQNELFQASKPLE